MNESFRKRAPVAGSVPSGPHPAALTACEEWFALAAKLQRAVGAEVGPALCAQMEAVLRELTADQVLFFAALLFRLSCPCVCGSLSVCLFVLARDTPFLSVCFSDACTRARTSCTRTCATRKHSNPRCARTDGHKNEGDGSSAAQEAGAWCYAWLLWYGLLTISRCFGSPRRGHGREEEKAVRLSANESAREHASDGRAEREREPGAGA